MMSFMKRRTILFGAAGLLAMFGTALFAWKSSSSRAPAANRAIGAQSSGEAPAKPDSAAFYEASLPDLDGRTIALRDYLGRPTVVNFWATWCAPCVQEMPYLDEIAKNPNMGIWHENDFILKTRGPDAAKDNEKLSSLAVERKKLFLAASFCKAIIKVAYVLAFPLDIKSTRKAPTLRPPT
jgi:thiol-disulfide isomerase/thioredoxin